MTLSDLSLPSDFSNRVRLFPLPNLVVFPGVMQGLHIFEPRYRQLVEDAVASDQLIAMGVYRPELPPTLDTDPPIYQTVCIGKIVTHAKLEDGRYNLLLLGAQRAKIVDEVATDQLYRTAVVQLMEDRFDLSTEDQQLARQQLTTEFKNLALAKNMTKEAIQNLVSENLPFNLFVDLVCYSLSCPIEDRVNVLETEDMGQRSELVLQLVREQLSLANESDGDQDFPPGFSLN